MTNQDTIMQYFGENKYLARRSQLFQEWQRDSEHGKKSGVSCRHYVDSRMQKMYDEAKGDRR